MSIWAVVPAAGIGTRMGAHRPKQYLPLCGRTVLDRTLSRLCAHARIDGVVVCIADRDPWWPECERRLERKPMVVAPGGAERAESVNHGLTALAGSAEAGDWVLVHDAVRPCVRGADIDRLIEAVIAHGGGGLLALPMSDTVKQADGHDQVVDTLPRERLWCAQTPQMFPFGALRDALRAADAAGVVVTDEAQAMERLGARPLLVAGHADNIKITVAEDLAVAEWYLQQQADQ